MQPAPFGDLLTCVEAFQEADLPFMVVGALAVSAHGEPRTTEDIDIVFHLPFEDNDPVERVIHDLTDQPLEERKDEMGHRLVTFLPSGMMLEAFFTYGHPFYKEEYDRRVVIEVDGTPVPFISPEDLILRKLVNTKMRRGVDLQDAFAVAQVQGDDLDYAYLREHCAVHRVCGLVGRIEDASMA